MGLDGMALSSVMQDGVYCAELTPATPSDRTFLLLHGLGGSLQFWTAVAPPLGAVERTLAIDVPGLGRSAAPPGTFTLDSVADAIIDFAHRREAKNCTIVAHSLGGLIGLKVAARDPDLCRRLILVDGTPVGTVGLLQHPLRALRAPRLAATVIAQFIAGLVPLRPGTARLIAGSKLLRTVALWAFVAKPARLDPALTAAALSYTGGARSTIRVLRQSGRVDLLALLDAVRAPVDLVRGDHDIMNSAADFAIVRQHVDVRRELVIPDCRHWPVIEAPEALTEFILSDER
jgi:pimeloyl-ACP methyl ester carboxylesterase